MFFKILNLKSQATPVGTIPRYITDIIESVRGIVCQGCSIKLARGINIIIAHISIEPVTFSFFFLLIFKVKTPPIT